MGTTAVRSRVGTCALVLFLVALNAVRCSASESTLDVRLGKSVALLGGAWKFHPGDNPAWAQTDLNDSDWGTIDVTPPPGSVDPITGATGFVPGWTTHGYPHLAGFAWYRLRVNVTNDAGGRLALRMPINFDDAYQVFVNGQLIGEFGEFTAKHATYFNAQPRAFPLPEGVSSGPITIAVRMWMEPSTILVSQDAGGMHGSPMLGQDDSIEAMLRLAWDQVNRTELGNLLSCSLSLLAGILGLALFWLDRREKAYLLLSLACAAAFLDRAAVLVGYYTMFLNMTAESILQTVLLTPLNMALWAVFWAYWFRIQRVERITRVTAGLLIAQVAGAAALAPPLYGDVIPPGAAHWIVPANLVLKLALGAVLLGVCIHGIRKRVSGAWLTLAPVLLTMAWQYNYELEVIHATQLVHIGGVVLNTGQLSNVVMLGIVSILLMQRFVRGQRQQELLRVFMPARISAGLLVVSASVRSVPTRRLTVMAAGIPLPLTSPITASTPPSGKGTI